MARLDQIGKLRALGMTDDEIITDLAEELGRLQVKHAIAVAAERKRAGASRNEMRDEILHGDGTLNNDQTNWVLSILDDHDDRVSNPESRKQMSTEYATPAPHEPNDS